MLGGGGVSINDFIFIHDFTNLNYPSTHVYIAEIHVKNSKRYSRGGGGALRFEYVPTAKRSPGAEAVNAKIQGWSTPFGGKKGGGQLQSKNIIGAIAYNLCLYSLYFNRYMAFFT